MPRSIAAPTSWLASWAVGATPKVAVPRQIWDTFTPVDPRTEYFIVNFLVFCGGDEGIRQQRQGRAGRCRRRRRAVQALSWVRELDSSRNASACACRVCFLLGDVEDRGEGDETVRR